MDSKKKQPKADEKVAPGVDPDESFGEDAKQSEIKADDYTTVTRLTYDEYDASEK
ncbi:hypothetical protein [Aquibacillus rhizosphaerae]|uniref:DUF4025 domain-containing protein n=1 Tax=Aquibacillus rhizosphaerae TaxID=3051431 RepID=A0ABT7L8S5_9BACI|nr:hypothetical protein [Aquibacillus sp. LR5S19]MDL4842251.1 hypothetical protein [Aquibacillus sp. LR5S19]